MHSLSWAGAYRGLSAQCFQSGRAPAKSGQRGGGLRRSTNLGWAYFYSAPQLNLQGDLVKMCCVFSESWPKIQSNCLYYIYEKRGFQLRRPYIDLRFSSDTHRYWDLREDFWPEIVRMGVLPLLFQLLQAYPHHRTLFNAPFYSSVSPLGYEFFERRDYVLLANVIPVPS